MNAIFQALTGLELIDPGFLLALVLLPLALWWRRRRGAPAVPFGPGVFLHHADGPGAPTGRGVSAAAPLPRSLRARLVLLPRGLQLFAVALAVLALARPVRRTPLPDAQAGIDIVLCLDTSSSMAATDMDAQRTRLQVAKDAAARFIAGRPHDRIGRVSFARFPDLRCPPTLDHRTLDAILADVAMVTRDGPEDATGIGTAVARAVQVLNASEAKARVAILLTDGEENVATAQTPTEIAPAHAGQLAADARVRVYTIAAGIGSRDARGAWLPIDTAQVERLAGRTGGAFFAARDASAIAGVYQRIDTLEKVELQEPKYRLDEMFVPFLLAALGLWWTGRLLSATWLRVLP